MMSIFAAIMVPMIVTVFHMRFVFDSTLTYWMIESKLICAGIICNFSFSPRLDSTVLS